MKMPFLKKNKAPFGAIEVGYFNIQVSDCTHHFNMLIDIDILWFTLFSLSNLPI